MRTLVDIGGIQLEIEGAFSSRRKQREGSEGKFVRFRRRYKFRFSMTSLSTAPESNTFGVQLNGKSPKNLKTQVIWYNVFLLLFLHLSAIYGLFIGLRISLGAWMFQSCYGIIGGFGITAGAHRLWCHRSYKAKLPLRILLAAFVSIAAETDIYVWCRDHRVHHKFSETDADPHNIKRGFFFAHAGWLMCKKHPDVLAKGKTVYLDDLTADPVVRYQRKFHIPLCLFFCFYFPTMILHLCFDMTQWDAFFHSVLRYVLLLNATWLVNSAAHMFGDRPFDKGMEASEHKLVAFIAQGEGWHNYHHVFPWDYSTSELGYHFNLTKVFIDTMAVLGLAYDLKSASKEEIRARKLRTGDGTRLKGE